jgi:hypothetical protein
MPEETAPDLSDLPSEQEVPEELDDDFMLALHELDVADVEVTDGCEQDAGGEGHGHNEEEEMV